MVKSVNQILIEPADFVSSTNKMSINTSKITLIIVVFKNHIITVFLKLLSLLECSKDKLEDTTVEYV